jgi:hypothetical protein
MGAPAENTIEFAICRSLARANLHELCERVSTALESSGATMALCDVSRARADAVTVEALARLQLAARRRGCRASCAHWSSSWGWAKCCSSRYSSKSRGSPKSGKTRSVSRKNVNSTILPCSISSTCSAHGS